MKTLSKKLSLIFLVTTIGFLAGCNSAKMQVSSYWKNHNNYQLLCSLATEGFASDKKWTFRDSYKMYVTEAQSLGLDCGVGKDKPKYQANNKPFKGEGSLKNSEIKISSPH